MKNALEAINWLQEEHTVYMFTNRNAEEVEEWLVEQGFPPLLVTNRKLPDTHIYIDDRAIRFTNWKDMCKLLG